MSAQILWAVVIGFLVGVFLRSIFLISWPFAAFFLLIGIASFLFFRTERKAVLVVIAIALTACAVGVVRMDFATLKGDANLDQYVQKSVVIEGVVADEPDQRDSNIRLHVRVDSLITNSATSSVAAGVLVIAPLNTDASYGDRIRAEGTLELPEPFDTNLGRQFDYPMFLAKDGIVYTLSFAQVENISLGRGNRLKAAAIWSKQKYLQGLHLVLPEPESGLAGGITVGDKRGGGKELTDIFISVGLVHIVVLSGYNITLIMDFVARTLSRAARSIQMAASVFVVVFIVVMAGASATAVRAGAMALLPLAARMSGRLYIAARALGVVALLMVMWNPYLLVFDPGFQLSVLATLGLVIFSPIVEERLQWVTERWGIRGIISATLATQAMVLPLLLYQNGLLSIVSLPANIFALVAVPFGMILSAISALAGIVVGSLGVVIAFPAYVLLAYIIKVAEFFASLPFASVSIESFSFVWVIAAYAMMYTGYRYIKSKSESVETNSLSVSESR